MLPRIAILIATAAVLAPAQQSLDWSVDAGNDYWIQPDIVYNVAGDHQNKLDVIYPHNAAAPVPAVI